MTPSEALQLLALARTYDNTALPADDQLAKLKANEWAYQLADHDLNSAVTAYRDLQRLGRGEHHPTLFDIKERCQDTQERVERIERQHRERIEQAQ